MKKTHNINLSGQVFCIDEDACQQLQSYIETLEKYYLQEEGGKEIMSDIESRIAELFHESLQKNHKEVISLSDIEHVISIMGAPDVIINDDQEYIDTPSTKRKLYRDADNKVFGGVAAGIATYVGISMVWVRLAFILLTFVYGITLLIYIVLWMVLPKAVTAKQKLEMKGKSINVSNLEKNIRHTYNEVKKNSKLQHFIDALGRAVGDFFMAFGRFVGKIFSVLLSIFAIFCLLGGVFFFLLLGWLILFPGHFTPEYLYQFMMHATSPLFLGVVKITLLVIIEIPLFLIIYYSARHLFRFQSHKTVLFISVSLWTVACLSGIFMGIYQTLNFSQEHRLQNELPLIPSDTTSKSLYVNFILKNAGHYSSPSDAYLSDYLYDISQSTSDSSLLWLQPELYLTTTTDPWPGLQITKKARGFSTADAIRNAETILYDYKWQNDTLTLHDCFMLASRQWRSHTVKIKISIPENYRLHLMNAPRQEIVNKSIFKNRHHSLNKAILNQSYRMQQGKLEKL